VRARAAANRLATRAGTTAALVAAAALLVLAGAAMAHERSISYSTWRLDGRRAAVTLRITALDLSRLPPEAVPAGIALGDWLAGQLQLAANGAPCVPDGPVRQLTGAGGRSTFEWTVACPDEHGFVVRSDLLRAVAPSHLHFARVLRPGAPAEEVLLSFDAPSRALAAATDAARGAQPAAAGPGFVALGVEHILTGLDHLAFVAALLLGAATLADVARVVTGFTVGHTLTLAAATLGWVRADVPAVNALIGASIALVAVESLWAAAARTPWLPWLAAAGLAGMALGGGAAVPAPALLGLALFVLCAFRALALGASAGAMRWGVASLFGLIHGFGFASVLAEAELPPARLAAALLGFNAGVELGQLGVVLLAWPLLATARQRAGAGSLVEDTGNAALVALGTCWFLVRCYR